MTVEIDREVARPAQASSVIETALRWLAIRKEGEPLRFLRYALEDPASESALVLGCLVEPTATMPEATPEPRAFAVWGLIAHEISKLGSAEDSRRRNTLMAAFRLPQAPDTGWKATLDDRFRQLTGLPGVFGDPPPTTTTPMHKAWRRAVGKLADCLAEKLELLGQDGREWQDYAEIGRKAAEQASGRLSSDRRSGAESPFRAPSPGAQPVFVERMLIRVVMRRRLVSRRMTERDIVAREDGVDGFEVLASAGRTADLSELPVKALWACRLSTPRAKSPAPARLRFPKVLRRGDRHHFVSETWDDDPKDWKRRIGVVVDHHGIAPGAFDDHGRPIAGLTVQVNFDPQCLPDACWWYAEQTEPERLRRPPDGDRHLLEVADGFVEHTFEKPCQPREGYGIVFKWPHE
ncbi:hypothetical protein AB0F52_42025 [Amycolatopsis sp. NPDC024027]|uniref:hypothetical protein n=1 Tax=Amycolatopsis sp. NPDC024027 TaxID=3154327 RepID=UPI0033D19DB3